MRSKKRWTLPTASRCCGTASWSHLAAKDMTRDALVRMMVGREMTASQYATHGADPDAPSPARRGEKALSVENVTMGGVVKNMSFSAFDGEVVGIFGSVGAGRSEIAQIICGARKRNFLRGGMIYLRDKPVRYRVPRQAMRDGIAYITEDRKVDGFFETMTVDQNIYLGFLSSPRVKRFLYSTREMKRIADEWIASLSISALKRTSQDRGIFRRQPAESRGRQVARAGADGRDLRRADARGRRQRDPADPCGHPQARSEQKAVIVISSYLPEILAISDRILVARGGRIVEEMARRRRDRGQDHVCGHSLTRESSLMSAFHQRPPFGSQIRTPDYAPRTAAC